MTEEGLLSLLPELEQAGVTDVWTDGEHVFAHPRDHLSMRLRSRLCKSLTRYPQTRFDHGEVEIIS